MSDAFAVSSVATVRNDRVATGDDDWGSVVSRIELDDSMPAESLDGIDGFSHVEILFVFHRLPADAVVTGARHPRDNPEWPRVGIFAQRGRSRPNRLGATVAEVVRRDGRTLVVRGLDAVDGTPVLDIKPVMLGFLPRGEVSEPEWAAAIMRRYWALPGAAGGRPDGDRSA